jgi:predicted deacetylase
MKAVCVSLHDVAPDTWPRCERLLAAFSEFGRLPITLLVVPNYLRHGTAVPAWYHSALQGRVARGDELALHGYAHWDDIRVSGTAWDLLSRRNQAAGESEFASLSRAQAADRLEKGQEWFLRQGWSVKGFIAPGWLLSRGTWEVLRYGSTFTYTTTIGNFHVLRPNISVVAPSVTYSTRSRLRRTLPYAWNSALSEQMERAPLVRIALHPADVDHPAILLHARQTLKQLLTRRCAMTKAAYAAILRESLSAERIPQLAR